MRRFIAIIVGFLLFTSITLHAQNPVDSTKSGKTGKIKTGWNFGGVPAITYNSDLGFQYGAVLNFFYYGDGKTYPKYLHNIYLEWSRYTKGSGINMLRYDSEHLIPGVRVSGELSYLTEQALDFYGFNGYQTIFNPDLSNDKSTSYISRMFYRMDRKMLKFRGEFMGNLVGKEFRWFAGFEFSNIKLATVDIARLNKGKSGANLLPDTLLLYDKYVQWGLIPQNQKNGGNNMLLKFGVVYDTRDNEPNPMKGIWSELQFLTAPSFIGNGDYSYSKLVLTHRQYFTLAPNVLSFTYRLSYQAKLGGTIPFYMLPFEYNSPPDYTRDGYGGSKTIRGVIRNRVVGDGVAFGNAEFRWKFLRTILWNQNLYLAWSAFTDGGIVTNDYKVNLSNVPAIYQADASNYFATNSSKDGLHLGYGSGLHLGLNENFVVALDVAFAAKKEDGKMGLYIGIGWLF
jgi:outer membrane protein assembly factor BamA